MRRARTIADNGHRCIRVRIFTNRAMKIAFVETEAGEREFFTEELPEHELQFARELDEIGPETEGISAFIDSQIDAKFLDAHPALRLVALRSTTSDRVDLEACVARGVAVRTVASYGDYTVAEHAFALLLALARKLRKATSVIYERRFSYEQIRGCELRGKTIGIIGAGRIGLHTAEIARGFRMEVLVYDLAPRAGAAEALGFRYVPLAELLERSHFISLHASLTRDTYHLLDAAALARCRPGVFIVNTARGGLIDTEALIEALDAGAVGGVGLDVLEDERIMRRTASHIIRDEILQRLEAGGRTSELRAQEPGRIRELQGLMRNEMLLARPNVIFTPHIAFNTHEAIERINRASVENIRAFLA